MNIDPSIARRLEKYDAVVLFLNDLLNETDRTCIGRSWIIDQFLSEHPGFLDRWHHKEGKFRQKPDTELKKLITSFMRTRDDFAPVGSKMNPYWIKVGSV